ncbi:MAG: HAMP domain-containing histidine kinase, partial [Agathobacter sp.]|uniref:sensor histidine kinase n=1 Tax=Agathobacter sp. TaxID=2021311 RepID=UPI002580FFED
MKQKGKEFEISFHLIYLCVLTILGLVMLWVETGAGRPIAIRILCLLVLILIWVAHCTQIGTASQRVYFYTITVTLFLMYYGSHRASITDMPLVLCLILIVLSLQEDMGLIYLISISYPLMILHHIFITQYLSENMTKLVLSRLVLGVVCVGLSVFISHFFIRANENKRQELLKMQKEIENSRNQTKNLLANVSHELRTPITAINGMTEILLQRQLDESLMGQIDDIHQSGQKIQSQINGILDYAELNTGTMVLNEQVYNVRELVDRCAYALYANRDDKNLAVSVDVDSSIPAFLYGDGEKIVRAMHQLIVNAYKFTNYGSIRLRVFCRREDYGINLIFEVSDTGVGMSKELIHRLFEGAYKEDADSARLTSGLGIGFTIAHELTRAMN